MKTLEQVKNYLEVEGMNKNDIHKVIGFLYAEGDFVLGTPLAYKVTDNSFQSFVNWYEEDNDKFDELFEMRTNIEKLWSGVIKKVPKIDFNEDTFDLCEHRKAIEDCKTNIEAIEDVLKAMTKILVEMEDEKEEEEAK